MPNQKQPPTKPLGLRLVLGSVGSCSCGTKTNDIWFHDELCVFRLLREASEVIEPDLYVEKVSP